MPPKILITRPVFPDVIAMLREYFDVEVNEGAHYTPEQLQAALKDKDGVLLAGGEKINAATLEGLTRLKAICVSAAGYNIWIYPPLPRPASLLPIHRDPPTKRWRITNGD